MGFFNWLEQFFKGLDQIARGLMSCGCLLFILAIMALCLMGALGGAH